MGNLDVHSPLEKTGNLPKTIEISSQGIYIQYKEKFKNYRDAVSTVPLAIGHLRLASQVQVMFY